MDCNFLDMSHNHISTSVTFLADQFFAGGQVLSRCTSAMGGVCMICRGGLCQCGEWKTSGDTLIEVLFPQQLTSPPPSISPWPPTAVNMQVGHGADWIMSMTAAASVCGGHAASPGCACVQVGSSSRRSPPLMSLSGAVCVSGWWSDSRWHKILGVLLIIHHLK